MNANQKIANDALALLRGFAGVQALAEAFANVGQLQQAENEAQTALDKVRPVLAQTNEDIAAGEARVAELNAQIEALQEEAKTILRTANDDAARIVRQAVDEAGKTRQEAADASAAKRDEGDQALAAAQARVDALKGEAAALEKRVANAKDYIKKLGGTT